MCTLTLKPRLIAVNFATVVAHIEDRGLDVRGCIHECTFSKMPKLEAMCAICTTSLPLNYELRSFACETMKLNQYNIKPLAKLCETCFSKMNLCMVCKTCNGVNGVSAENARLCGQCYIHGYRSD